jgi:hypothetical protein
MVKVKKYVKGQSDSKKAKIPTPAKGKAIRNKMLKKGQLKRRLKVK